MQLEENVNGVGRKPLCNVSVTIVLTRLSFSLHSSHRQNFNFQHIIGVACSKSFMYGFAAVKHEINFHGITFCGLFL